MSNFKPVFKNQAHNAEKLFWVAVDRSSSGKPCGRQTTPTKATTMGTRQKKMVARCQRYVLRGNNSEPGIKWRKTQTGWLTFPRKCWHAKVICGRFCDRSSCVKASTLTWHVPLTVTRTPRTVSASTLFTERVISSRLRISTLSADGEIHDATAMRASSDRRALGRATD